MMQDTTLEPQVGDAVATYVLRSVGTYENGGKFSPNRGNFSHKEHVAVIPAKLHHRMADGKSWCAVYPDTSKMAHKGAMSAIILQDHEIVFYTKPLSAEYDSDLSKAAPLGSKFTYPPNMGRPA